MSFEDRDNPCVICQSTEFVWGHPASENGVWFKADEPIGSVLGEQSGFGVYGLAARVCRGCGNVQLFMKYYPPPEKKKRE